MKKTIPTILFLFLQIYLFSQEIYIANDNLYGNLANGEPEKDSLLISTKNGKTISIGKYAISKKGLSNLKIGYWKEYNDEGKLTREGNYKIGSYLQCCVGGLCRQYYFYRDGIWKFYESEIEYQLNFEPSEIFFDTSCKKNDKLIFGTVSNYSYNNYGTINPDFIFKNQKIDIENENYIEIYTPLNGRLYISIK